MSIRQQTVLERLRVKNFRSLANLDLTFDRLLVLVGANSSGKSTIIDVLRFVRDALTRDLDAAIVDRGGIASIRRWSHRGASDISIQINLRDAQWSGEYGFVIGSEQRGAWRVKSEWLHIIQQEDFDELASKPTKLIAYRIKGGRLEGNIEGLEPFVAAVKPLISDTNLFLGQIRLLPLSSAIDAIAHFVSGMSFYSIFPDGLRKPQKPGNDYPLDESGQNLASVLRNLQRKRRNDAQHVLNDALGRVVKGISSYNVQQIGGFLVTRLQHAAAGKDRQGPAFDLSQESDGTLRMLGILTALYQDPPRSLLTIEEPELTIHPGALGVLCDVIQEASARSQVIVTTHSPDLIDRFPMEALRIVEKQHDATQAGPVSSEQRDVIARQLFSPGELLRIEGLERDTAVVREH